MVLLPAFEPGCQDKTAEVSLVGAPDTFTGGPGVSHAGAQVDVKNGCEVA